MKANFEKRTIEMTKSEANKAGKIGVCFFHRISQMKQAAELAQSHGFNPICIWSIRNEEHFMSEEQLQARESILKNFEIPEQYDLLIINASSETSIKIKSHVDFVMIHSENYDTQVQVRGRVNSDLSKLYLPAMNTDELIVPAEFLGIKLYREDKTRLCEVLNQRDTAGRRYEWQTIKRKLIESDYQIIEKRDGRSGSRYAIITQASE